MVFDVVIKSSIYIIKMIYENVINIYTKLLPEKLRIFIKREIHLVDFILYKRNLKKKILKYYENEQHSDHIQNIEEMISFLKRRPIHVFPYNFIDKYKQKRIEVKRDKDVNLNYIYYNNKRLYFKREFTKSEVKNYFKSLMIEQDNNSPHLYLKDSFVIQNNDNVIDIGAAEGMFALSIIDTVGEIYIFESDESWIESLKVTFQPWANKTTIIKSFVTNKTNGNCIKLDDYFIKKKEINFIKIDVEGEEQNVIFGAKDILTKASKIRIVVATYHNQNDSHKIKQLLHNYGFLGDFSDGYMLYFHDRNIEPPFFRKGLIRATKITN
jgi:hypothetical protein